MAYHPSQLNAVRTRARQLQVKGCERLSDFACVKYLNWAKDKGGQVTVTEEVDYLLEVIDLGDTLSACNVQPQIEASKNE